MWYEINVAKDGKHYFATADRSITTAEKAKEVHSHFCDVFPAEQGYSIYVTRWERHGEHVQF